MPTAPFTNPVAGTYDVEQVALAKLVYWLQVAVGSSGTTTMFKPSMAANWNDSKQTLMVKAAYWAQQLSGGGTTASGGITSAAGAPPVDGSVTTLFYKNSSTGDIFINSGTIATPTWDSV